MALSTYIEEVKTQVVELEAIPFFWLDKATDRVYAAGIDPIELHVSWDDLVTEVNDLAHVTKSLGKKVTPIETEKIKGVMFVYPDDVDMYNRLLKKGGGFLETWTGISYRGRYSIIPVPFDQLDAIFYPEDAQADQPIADFHPEDAQPDQDDE